ncbi:uncharacterized protein LOC121373789 [Gigantopelta aegis]|uniref:uncharacterized protein LOC121373789 n=1 Tax=Gigantopelta aegis TaxID=1735272 RepID=UPI001B88DAE8|nr:uncharacterized protein LOC121373789 [Gigantopelta aegis]XP_041356484.1 uncharacterized protein LOC121373789 [Gigantopelta aegis]
MGTDVLSCSAILERYVIPRLRLDHVSDGTQKQFISIFGEHISRCLVRLGEYMGRSADVITSKLQSCGDVTMLDQFLAHTKRTHDNFESYISKVHMCYTSMLEMGPGGKSDGETCSRDQPHLNAIKKHFNRLRKDILTPQGIVDHLVAGGVFTEDDVESIASTRLSRRERNEELLKRIADKCSSEQFTSVVLPAIKEDHPQLEEILQETLREQASNTESESRKRCGFCLIQSTVEPRRLAQHLLEVDAISRNVYTDLRNAQLPNTVKWSILFDNLKNCLVLEAALRVEYPAVVDEVVQNGGVSKECVCSQNDGGSNLHQGSSVFACSSPQSDIACNSDLESMLNDLDDRSTDSGTSSPSIIMSNMSSLTSSNLPLDGLLFPFYNPRRASPGSSPRRCDTESVSMTDKLDVMKLNNSHVLECLDQVPNEEINKCAKKLVKKLVRFQHQFNRISAEGDVRPRIVLDAEKVVHHLNLRHIKCVIIFTNPQKSKGGLYGTLNNIVRICQQQGVPVMRASERRGVRSICNLVQPLNVCGICNYEGCEEMFWKLLDLTHKAPQCRPAEMVASLPSAALFYRTDSNRSSDMLDTVQEETSLEIGGTEDGSLGFSVQQTDHVMDPLGIKIEDWLRKNE